MTGRRPSSRWIAPHAVLVAVVALVSACAPAPAAPASATIREIAPPWDAPRDAVSHFEVAQVPQLPRGYAPTVRLTAQLVVVYDGEPVVVPANIGIDQVRAIESPVHTHDDDGVVWVEDPEPGRSYTLGQLFDLWGVRLDDDCLADACEGLTVTRDGVVVDTDVRAVVLEADGDLRVEARR